MNEIEKFIEEQKNLGSPDYRPGGKHFWDIDMKAIEKQKMKMATLIPSIMRFVGILLLIYLGYVIIKL